MKGNVSSPFFFFFSVFNFSSLFGQQKGGKENDVCRKSMAIVANSASISVILLIHTGNEKGGQGDKEESEDS